MPARPAPARRPRMPLTRARILAAALTLVDRHGVEGLTMRSLGHALSVEAMSLYNHVSGKDDVLTGLSDLVLGMIEYPEDGGDWREAMRQAARSAWQATLAHPNVVPLLLHSPADTPGSHALAERVLARMVPAGFSPAEAHRIFRMFQAYVFGAVLMAQRSPTARGVRTLAASLAADARFPLLRHALLKTRRFDARADFEAGIELIIAAIGPPVGRSPRTRRGSANARSGR